jgi:hypothetical protein
MASKTLRNLASGTGTVSMTNGSAELVFSSAQDFKLGATVKAANSQLFTVQRGSGTTWVARQKATTTASGQSFTTTDPSASRARGSSGVIVPRSVAFAYMALIDDAGAPDYYVYIDTVMPDAGLHPYTRDPMISMLYASASTDTPTYMTHDRLRLLEGMLRGSGGSTYADPDKRLDDIELRLVALETWANSAGHFGTPPAVGSTQGGNFDTLMNRGDV